jgi:Flp pilus assembly protein TadG
MIMNVLIEILTPSRAQALRATASFAARSHPAARAIFRLAHLLASEEKGATLVEFALVSSMLLFPLLTLMMSMGSFMSNQMQLINAVDISARTVAVNGGVTLDPCSVASSAITAAAPGLNASQLTFSYSFNGTPYSGTTCLSTSLVTGAAGNLAGGTTASVTASYPCNLMIFGRSITPAGCAIKATTVEMVQ